MSNEHLVLISGESSTGKSASLQNIENHEGVIYLNLESGKRLPFRNKFKTKTVTDPMQVLGAFDKAEAMPSIHTIIVDSATFMMEMYESVYVLTSENTMAALTKPSALH